MEELQIWKFLLWLKKRNQRLPDSLVVQCRVPMCSCLAWPMRYKTRGQCSLPVGAWDDMGRYSCSLAEPLRVLLPEGCRLVKVKLRKDSHTVATFKAPTGETFCTSTSASIGVLLYRVRQAERGGEADGDLVLGIEIQNDVQQDDDGGESDDDTLAGKCDDNNDTLAGKCDDSDTLVGKCDDNDDTLAGKCDDDGGECDGDALAGKCDNDDTLAGKCDDDDETLTGENRDHDDDCILTGKCDDAFTGTSGIRARHLTFDEKYEALDEEDYLGDPSTGDSDSDSSGWSEDLASQVDDDSPSHIECFYPEKYEKSVLTEEMARKLAARMYDTGCLAPEEHPDVLEQVTLLLAVGGAAVMFLIPWAYHALFGPAEEDVPLIDL